LSAVAPLPRGEGGNAGLDYWRSNHREWKDHKVGGEEETIASKVETDPNFFWRICRLLSVFPRHTVPTVINLT